MSKYYEQRLRRIESIIQYIFDKGTINGSYHRQLTNFCNLHGIYEMRIGYLSK
jgi:hypothetical protein